MLEVNTGDWLSFTVAPARERSLSPCSGIDHDVKQVELAYDPIMDLVTGRKSILDFMMEDFKAKK